ncbi:hypothetical protein SASPL_131877 [Salvia splendens]|uniref:Uncharacterized protein n=1 Tax=Salvia splendens TaxID=180675 RepID=A0A8X8ZL09_SALSN|nr:hypothetical protein SASPL_156934 [Salvia splendens]KAG6408852.1 hypothetical protein SASPL_131877 [Salvia splendens]
MLLQREQRLELIDDLQKLADTGHDYPWKVYHRRSRKMGDCSYMDEASVMEKALNEITGHDGKGNNG